jgi:long-chain acyl-CoA synthetase
MRTAPEFFDAALRSNPEARAVAFFDAELSYASVNARANAVAGWLRAQGIERTDRVVVQLQNVPQFVILALAMWRIGAVLVAVNPMYKRDELAHAITDSGARLFIGAAQTAPEARAACALAALAKCWFVDEFALQKRNDDRLHAPAPAGDVEPTLATIFDGLAEAPDGLRAGARAGVPVELRPEDPALICYTSGTSGSPKGALMSHDNIAVSAIAYREWWQIPEGTDIAAVAPLCHITGIICGLLLPWLTHAAAIMTYRFHADVLLEAFTEHRPGFMAATATAYQALLASPLAGPERFSSFRTLCSGGAALPTAVLDRFQRETGHYVYNGYGLTETSAACMSVPWQSIAPTDEEFGVVSTGRMLDGFDIRILDDDRSDVAAGELGEIAVSGRGVFSGYWRRPEVTAESFVDEYFLTGDIGCVRDDWIYVLDRKKELINASGFKVSPREVEDVLYRHPAVREAGVTAMPDDYRGEAVLAVISLRAGESVDVDEVRAFVRERLAAYKVPTQVIVVDELPKNTNGKILRRELAALAVRE